MKKWPKDVIKAIAYSALTAFMLLYLWWVMAQAGAAKF